MTWIGRISGNRLQAQGQKDLRAAQGAAKGAVDPKAFAETLISDKVLAKHGAALAPAAGDMQAIAAAGQHLATHRAAQFARSVDQFYSALGRSTDHLSEPTKGETIAASAKAMRGLVEALAQREVLMPAMAALSSLLEPRAEVDVPPTKHAEAAKAAVLELVESVEGREGASSMLFGFRNMVEAYEASQDGLTASSRPEIWDAVRAYQGAVVPRAGCDQGELGRVAGLFHRALRETPEDPKGALQRAQAQALEPMQAPREAAKAQLLQPLAGLAPEGPAAEAHAALSEALAKVIDENPAGPAELVASVEAAAGALSAQLPAVQEDRHAKGYQSLARLVELAGATPAARPLLEAIAQHGSQMASHQGARAVLARAQRVQNPESLAPVLLEAFAAAQGRNPAQDDLQDAVGKLKRLPPGPALNASVALMPYLGQPAAPALAEALFVESRRAETPEALAGFAERFVAAFQTLQNQVGDAAATVAGALARSSSRPLDRGRIQRVGQLVSGVINTLPDTPVDKLLGRGRDGQAGLLDLADEEAFIHDPQPMLFDLLRGVSAAAMGKESVAEARLAMGIAAQLGRLDREPRKTDFPRVLEDFTQALADPKTLTYAPVEGGAAAVKGQRRSATGFVAAHPALPPEIALTAGRALSEAQLGWMQRTLESSRSHAFDRALRDAVFAAVKTGRLDFVEALARDGLDTKAMTAAVTLVAQEHRQNHADQVPFDRLIEGLDAGQDPVAIIAREKAEQALAGLDLEGLDAVDPEGMARIQSVMKEIQSLLGFFDKAQYGAQPEHFLEPLKQIVKQQAEGTWPSYKYSTDAAKEHLQGLSEEQIAIWSREMVTGAEAPVAADDPESLEAMTLLAGVAKTLHREVDIKGKGFEDVGWSKASLASLSKTRDELVEELRRCQKGSQNHRRLSKKIGPIQARVALLELHLELKETFAGEPGPAQAVLSRIRPLARNALPALRKVGQSGFVHALDTAVAAAKEAPANPRQGLYAADEDHVEAYLTSFNGGSCISPTSGFNRGSLVELMGGSQYKMIRAVDGDKGVGRGFLRLIRVSLPNGYEGHAIAMDVPKGTQNYGKPAGRESSLMYEHALAKAVAMGVPLLVDEQDVLPAAQARGLKLERMQCAVKVHKGITGMHHNEGLNGGDYFINWPGMNGTPRGYDVPRDDMPYAERSYAKQVVMPPNWQKA